MLRKAKLPKNGSCHTILERWYKDADYQMSLSDEGWTEEEIRQHDAVALEDHSSEGTPEERGRWQRNWFVVVDHSYEGTPEERGRWQRNWFIVVNHEGVQGPIRQRLDFREAKHAYRQLYKEHAERTSEGNKSIHPAEQTTQNYRRQYEGSEEYTYTVHPRTGWKYCLSTSSLSSSQRQQNNECKSNQSWGYGRSSTWAE